LDAYDGYTGALAIRYDAATGNELLVADVGMLRSPASTHLNGNHVVASVANFGRGNAVYGRQVDPAGVVLDEGGAAQLIMAAMTFSWIPARPAASLGTSALVVVRRGATALEAYAITALPVP